MQHNAVFFVKTLLMYLCHNNFIRPMCLQTLLYVVFPKDDKNVTKCTASLMIFLLVTISIYDGVVFTIFLLSSHRFTRLSRQLNDRSSFFAFSLYAGFKFENT